MKQHEYDDNYPTCAGTYSTLRIFSDNISSTEIEKIIEIKSTESFLKGESYSKGLFRKTNGWFYSTKELTKSKDTRRHIDLILEILNGKEKAVEALQEKECKIDISSYWLSNGQGGPALWPNQMLRLGKLGIEVWWDIYRH